MIVGISDGIFQQKMKKVSFSFLFQKFDLMNEIEKNSPYFNALDVWLLRDMCNVRGQCVVVKILYRKD